MTHLIGELHDSRHACGETHLPNCYNPHSDDTYCVCGEVRWSGRVGTWHSRYIREDGAVIGYDRYFMHADTCPDRIIPDEYAIESVPGSLKASHPTFTEWCRAQVSQQNIRGLQGGPPAGVGPDWPRILWRVTGGPWMVREALPKVTHLCGLKLSPSSSYDDAAEPTLLDLLEESA